MDETAPIQQQANHRQSHIHEMTGLKPGHFMNPKKTKTASSSGAGLCILTNPLSQ
jgi:hypothetical protein